VDRGRIELPIEACKATVIPFNYQPKFLNTLFGMCVLKHTIGFAPSV